jgi:hypothetical protein
MAILWNNNMEPFIIQPRDRIAQPILEKIETLTPMWSPKLPKPLTDHQGFRSTGIQTITAELPLNLEPTLQTLIDQNDLHLSIYPD